MHDLVDHILAPTYGVVVYQEQVMQIAQALAGYSLGGADLLRRAMGKKKPEEMAKQKSIFLEGAEGLNVDGGRRRTSSSLLEYFAGYGFNKSHSAAYALITYQTAYLKAHYPVELLCSIMTSDKDKIEKVVRTIADARAMGVTVLPPDIDESDVDFKVVYTHPEGNRKIGRQERVKDACGPQIRFGLGAVRGVGGGALETVFEARDAGGAFHDLFEFAGRVDAKKINKSVLEALVQCGAFDRSLTKQGVSRARAFASIDLALERSRAASRDRERGQTNLFGLFDKPASDAAPATARHVLVLVSTGEYAQSMPWDRREALRRERDSLGFYVSGNPLERYLRGGAARLDVAAAADCAGMDDWSVVRLVGMVEGYRERMFKDGGGKIAFFDLEDLTGRVTVKVRGREIETYAQLFKGGDPVLVSGKVSFPRRDEDADPEAEEGPREPTILLNEARLLVDVIRADTKALAIRLPTDRNPTSRLDELARVLGEAKGDCPVTLYVALPDGAEATLSLGRDWRVEVGDPLLSGLEKVFGEQVAELR